MTSETTDDDFKPHIVLPTTPHTHTIIFLHGRSSNAPTFCSEIFETQDTSQRFFAPTFPSVKWVFPCAKKSLAASEGDIRHQWFDMPSVLRPWLGPDIQKPGLQESAARILDILRAEAQIVGGMERVIVAGLSQGCATSIYTLLASDVRVGGFVGICGWLPAREELDGIVKMAGRANDVFKMPVLLQHCQDDWVVPMENGKNLAEWLEGRGMPVKWETFEEGGHWLNEPKGMDGVVRFIEEVMASKKESVAG